MHGTFSIGKPSYLKSFSHDLAILFRDHFLSDVTPKSWTVKHY